jgi:biopolymer transport protein ExbB
MSKISIALLLVLFFFSFAASAQVDGNVPSQAGNDVQPAVVDSVEAGEKLQAAYQKEYAFLEAQLRDLRQRSAEFSNQATRAESEKQAQIDLAEGEWINLQSQSESTQALLTEAERALESVDDARTTLEATFLQAQSTLEPYVPGAVSSQDYVAGNAGERINFLFGQAIELLNRIGKVYEVAGAFFLADGTEVQGTIIRVGNIAAYGISESGGGALAPAGEGRLKVWSQPAWETAQALSTGNKPAQLGMFLFESESKAIEEQAGKTVLGVINSGGTIAWIIVALGAVALILIVLRLVFLRKASAATGEIVYKVGSLVRLGKVEEAMQACKSFKGSTARVVYMAVRNLERDRTHLEDIISEAILHESSHLNRFGAMILVIAAVAPLLGLLGTVTGMITTFDIITEFGTGDPKLLSGGISIALVTTEIGLAVAIPALLAGNVLSGWSESIKDDMEKGALGVINQFKEHRRTV